MKQVKQLAMVTTLVMMVFGLTFSFWTVQTASAAESKNLIYDEANLLSEQEKSELNALANEYGAERQTDFIIFTSNNEEHKMKNC